MKKVFLILFLVIFLSFMVSARSLDISQSERDEINAAKEDGDVAHCENIEGIDGKDSCYSIIVSNSDRPNPLLCEEIYSQDIKDPCYNSASSALKDVNLCKKISGQSIRDLCYTNGAISELDVSFCDEIIKDSQKDFCYLKVAEEKEDSDLCDEIKDGRYRDDCFSSLDKRDPQLPDYDSSDKKRGFFSKLFSFFGKIFGRDKVVSVPECHKDNLLKELNEEEAAYYAESEYYFDLLQRTCYVNYALKNEDISVCGNLDSEGKETCITGVAVQTNDDSLCEKLKDVRYKDVCFEKVAIETGNVALCSEIERYSGKKNLCITSIAKAKGDITMCDEIVEEGSTFYIDQCKILATISSQDASSCKELNNLNDRNNCYINIARSTGNLSLCENVIIEGAEKALSLAYCKDEVSRYS